MKRSDIAASEAGGMAASKKPTPKALAVQLSSVSVGGGSKGTLHDVSLSIESTSQIALVGPRGSGKSALLACIAGKKKPSSGKIQASGRLSTVEQKFEVNESHTAIENVLDGVRTRRKWRTKLFGIPNAKQAQAQELLQSFGVRPERKAEGLSPKERVLVAIARALMEEPDILLVDEPISGLSFRDSDEVLGLFREQITNRKLTSIIVLNNFSLAGKHSDRVIALEKGIIVYDGTNIDPWPERRVSPGMF